MTDGNDLRSPALAGVRAHFQGLQTRVIEVPEWGADGAPLVIYVSPLTLAEQQKIREAGERDGASARLVQVLLTKALDRDGRPLFGIADKATLLTGADPTVLSRVVVEILTGVRSIEEHEKN